MKGKLIVIEGGDATGKTTQVALLAAHLRKEGKQVSVVSFPRYGSFFGKLVKRYLYGAFGSLEKVPPEVPSLLYALDRQDAAPAIRKRLEAGAVVIADRFSASNIAHQGAKLSGKKQAEFIRWLRSLDSRLPEPAVTIYLDAPVSLSQRLMRKRGAKPDMHERDIAYIKAVRRLFLKLAKQRSWHKISCARNGRLLPIQEIHGLVWEKAKKYI